MKCLILIFQTFSFIINAADSSGNECKKNKLDEIVLDIEAYKNSINEMKIRLKVDSHEMEKCKNKISKLQEELSKDNQEKNNIRDYNKTKEVLNEQENFHRIMIEHICNIDKYSELKEQCFKKWEELTTELSVFLKEVCPLIRADNQNKNMTCGRMASLVAEKFVEKNLSSNLLTFIMVKKKTNDSDFLLSDRWDFHVANMFGKQIIIDGIFEEVMTVREWLDRIKADTNHHNYYIADELSDLI